MNSDDTIFVAGSPVLQDADAWARPTAPVLVEHWNCSGLGGILMLMRRKSWFRAVASVLAIWFPLIVGEPSVVHVCPTHSGVAMSTPSTVAMAHHHVASHDSPPGHDHHECSCISCCVGSVVAAPAVGTPVTAFVEAIFDLGANHSVVASPTQQAPEFSRPYTTGPPRA